ncbi:autotransporter domain-containing protein [Chlamydia vaughanii]|uniref:autotransporter domain-containing protein n=1 Tax=Chlamydia vaughanii TaxID=3112552 RepID=UPI0032B2A9DB
MVAKKVSRFQKSTFSHSVVVAILVSTGMITNNHRLYGYEPISEAFSDSVFQNKQLETASAGIFKKEKSPDTKDLKKEPKEENISEYESMLNDTSACVSHVLTSTEAQQGQYSTGQSTIFTVKDAFSWANISAALPDEAPKEDSATASESVENNQKYILQDPKHGLAFCYEDLSKDPKSETETCGLLGLAFIGDGAKSGLAFSHIKSTGAGAAVYSDEDVVFENLKEKLVFDGCESLEAGGAVSARSIAVNACHDVSLLNCRTDLDLLATGDITDFSQGGGAFNAHKLPSESHKTRLPSGDIFLIDNLGTFLVEGNHADKSNGGAIACSGLICSGNKGDVHYISNQALSGGAVSCFGAINICGNVGVVEFLKNQALAAPSDNAFLGGGALAAKERISLLNNGKIHCEKNSSKSSGGAFLSNSVRVVENVGDSLFKENSAEVTGGVISSSKSVEVSKNFGEVTFEKNKSKHGGGAIYCCESKDPFAAHEKDADQDMPVKSGEIHIIDNSGAINFIANENQLASQEVHGCMGGGALYGDNIVISGNIGDVTFSGNIASQCESDSSQIGGGAIFANEEVIISDNSGRVSFTYNKGNILSAPASDSPSIPESPSAPESPSTPEVPEVPGPAIPEEVPQVPEVPVARLAPIVSMASTGSEEESGMAAISEPARPVDLGVRGGGAVFAKKIVVKDNSFEVSFSDNFMEIQNNHAQKQNPLGGGALFGIDEVSVRNNADITFSNNYVSGDNSSGGAILSNVVDISDNGKVQFIRNGSKFLGGAVCSLNETLNINDNKTAVLFIGNRTTTAGGAVASAEGEVSLSRNHGKVEFKDNMVFGDPSVENLEEGQVDTTGYHSGGGAIFAKKALTISENLNKVLFSGNSSGCFGGAILTGSLVPQEENARFASKVSSEESKVIISGNIGDVIFSGNRTTVAKHPDHNCFGGGAIYTKDLIINNNEGAVSFYNNYAPTGGAVRIAEGGKVILEACGGDILFQGNRNLEDVSDGIYFSGKESRLTEVSAVGENCVNFADAVVFEDLTLRRGSLGHEDVLTDPTLIFNSKARDDDSVEHSGTVRFAYATSKIPQVAVLESGTLALSNKAQLWLCGLKQEKGSEILLSAGTVLRIFDPQEKQVDKPEIPSAMRPYVMDTSSETAPTVKTLADIGALGVDLSSFIAVDDESTPLPPQIIIPKGTVLGTGSLDLTLVDTAGVGYENHALLNKDTDIALLSLKTASSLSDPVDMDQTLETIKVHVSVPQVTESTYGHMGNWSAPKVIDGKLMINWKPTGYKLNPEKDGSIVLNALWGQYGDLRVLKQQEISHNITAQRMELDYSTNIWGSGMGTFSNCGMIAKVDGFNHRAGGYALGLDTQLIEDFLIGGSFAQFFGYTESQSYSSRSEQKGYLGSAYMGIFAGSWLFKGVFIYSDIHNDLNTTYPQSLGKSHGSWNSRGILADAHVDYRYIINSRRFISSLVSAFVPFVEVEYAYVDLPTFTESGSEARTFTEGHLQNVSVPFGVTLEHSYSRGQRSEVNSLSFSYALDVYRKQSSILINLPVASYSWNGEGSDLSRKSMKAQFNNNTEWNSYFSTLLGVTYEWREHTVAYDVNGGIRLIF